MHVISKSKALRPLPSAFFSAATFHLSDQRCDGATLRPCLGAFLQPKRPSDPNSITALPAPLRALSWPRSAASPARLTHLATRKSARGLAPPLPGQPVRTSGPSGGRGTAPVRRGARTCCWSVCARPRRRRLGGKPGGREAGAPLGRRWGRGAKRLHPSPARASTPPCRPSAAAPAAWGLLPVPSPQQPLPEAPCPPHRSPCDLRDPSCERPGSGRGLPPALPPGWGPGLPRRVPAPTLPVSASVTGRVGRRGPFGAGTLGGGAAVLSAAGDAGRRPSEASRPAGPSLVPVFPDPATSPGGRGGPARTTPTPAVCPAADACGRPCFAACPRSSGAGARHTAGSDQPADEPTANSRAKRNDPERPSGEPPGRTPRKATSPGRRELPLRGGNGNPRSSVQERHEGSSRSPARGDRAPLGHAPTRRQGPRTLFQTHEVPGKRPRTRDARRFTVTLERGHEGIRSGVRQSRGRQGPDGVTRGAGARGGCGPCQLERRGRGHRPQQPRRRPSRRGQSPPRGQQSRGVWAQRARSGRVRQRRGVFRRERCGCSRSLAVRKPPG